jgi:hypothetical protein
VLAGVFARDRVLVNRMRTIAFALLLMSTGLTFGAISALFGLSNGLIDQAQYHKPGCLRQATSVDAQRPGRQRCACGNLSSMSSTGDLG